MRAFKIDVESIQWLKEFVVTLCTRNWMSESRESNERPVSHRYHQYAYSFDICWGRLSPYGSAQCCDVSSITNYIF
uniref:Uncharacterized protein n=1 Tax=Arion vulgaris TaxID=1028688 RepID=A0A0B6ZIT7_9EUPU